MRKGRGLKLNLDIAYLSMFQGDVKVIAPGEDNEYVTVVKLTLPFSPSQISIGNFSTVQMR